MFLYVITILTVIIIYFCYDWVNKKHLYWRAKGVKGPTPFPFVGNFGSSITFKVHFRDVVKRCYTDFPNENVVGVYQGFKPALLLRDPNMVKQVLMNDFKIFNGRDLKNSDKPTYDNLFILSGEKWKALRQKLTPIFTASKVKSMMPEMEECVDRLLNYVDGLNHEGDHELQKMLERFALDALCCCVYGIKTNIYSENKNAFLDITKYINSASTFWWAVQFVDWIIPKTRNKVEAIQKYLDKSSYELAYFFQNLVSVVKLEKDTSLKQSNGLFKIMFELQNQEEHKNSQFEITDQQIAGQAFFMSGGNLEVSSAMSYVLYELARHQNIQDRIYKEISEVIENHAGVITYDALKEMTYLKMTIDETLRMHPIGGILIRNASYDYEFSESKVKVDKGTPVIISVDGLHMDPQYYEDPETFNPERFSPQNAKKIPKFAYLPFGDGPRQCIGMRYAQVQGIFGLAAFLKRFKVEVTDKTTKQVKNDPRSLRALCIEGIWVKISRRA